MLELSIAPKEMIIMIGRHTASSTVAVPSRPIRLGRLTKLRLREIRRLVDLSFMTLANFVLADDSLNGGFALVGQLSLERCNLILL